jgi:uncharacterized membrane-anchored protein YjiN (DUF445 family)
MFDLTATINLALQQAINDAIAPLIGRVAVLEQEVNVLESNLLALQQSSGAEPTDESTLRDLLDERLESAIENYDFSDTIEAALNDYDFDPAIKEVVAEYDMKEMITDILANEITFDVRVS